MKVPSGGAKKLPINAPDASYRANIASSRSGFFGVEIAEATDEHCFDLAGRRDLLDFVEVEFGLGRGVVAEACDALLARGHTLFA
jgi:hypothetical protein